MRRVTNNEGRLGGDLVLHASTTTHFGQSRDGAFHFPVFHTKHPCIDSSPIHTASVSDAGAVIENYKIHEGKYFMGISLGTPATFNLVTIDTGSTLSWVQCQRCQIFCHRQADEAGRIFDPQNSTTYRHIGCSNEDCIDLHQDNGVPYGCIEETDTCLYIARYGSSSQYSAGRLGEDRLVLGGDNNYTIVDDFIFGCSEDTIFKGYEAGVIGFGNKSYSYFNQVSRQTSYKAFAYCFPIDHQAEGFVIIGPYPRRLEVVTPLILGYGQRSHVYSIQQLDMMVDGKRLEVDPSVYTRRMMVVDTGTDETFISSPIFYAFGDAMTTAMQDKGYAREYDKGFCFTSTGGQVNWRGLPTVEMRFIRAILMLPPENVFHQPSAGQICLAFQPDTSGVRDVQILGSKALRSFRVVHDLQKMTLGFQARAC
ncbi:aspartic proteinase CDR1-like [Panicum miliaceum]|uniref:Aspartic proteinase CDR1-like n=1 Tax=Panicum miliaceum TaxID=4540 RepID=A0A3L6SZ35_PANMI|nr:aspartic proteinase CDR1-like [Panicum miliaceum]